MIAIRPVHRASDIDTTALIKLSSRIMLLVVSMTDLLQVRGSSALRRESLLKEAIKVAQRFFAQQRDNSVPHSKQRPVIGLRELPTTKFENPIFIMTQQRSEPDNSHATVSFVVCTAASDMKKNMGSRTTSGPLHPLIGPYPSLSCQSFR